jgi:hypothetical protein
VRPRKAKIKRERRFSLFPLQVAECRRSAAVP